MELGTGVWGFCSRAIAEMGEQCLSTFATGVTGGGCLAREIACSVASSSSTCSYKKGQSAESLEERS